ncbi:hypothetical protein B0H16DRAFT_1466008 [Mycena metata]|uniref:Uncharacterized protein n=1 Tax=Mycena metata TaxID=1033252 RepID=A0AAD7I9B6_9AGAR|nr:hypothetical protein B0H16DRAFT_1466008 [Mycena metata]
MLVRQMGLRASKRGLNALKGVSKAHGTTADVPETFVSSPESLPLWDCIARGWASWPESALAPSVPGPRHRGVRGADDVAGLELKPKPEPGLLSPTRPDPNQGPSRAQGRAQNSSGPPTLGLSPGPPT